MNTAASDDLIARVRVHLAGLEPPIRADDLTDEEVAGLVMEAIGCLKDWVIRGLLPERFRQSPPSPAVPVQMTPQVSEILQPYARFEECGTYSNLEEAQRDHFHRAIEETARTIRDNLTGRVLSGPTPPEFPLPLR